MPFRLPALAGRVPVWGKRGPLWLPRRSERGLLWVPQKGILRVQHNVGAVGADNTPGTTVTTGAAEATKGTPAELISAANNAFDTYWLRVVAYAYGLAATDSQGAMDILVGAATEEVLIANLLMGFCGRTESTTRGPKVWEFPIYIPAGTRIAAQAAGKRLSTAMRVAVYCYGGDAMPPFRVGRKVTTYGMGTVPFGTTIVPGASTAEGAWTQITASSSEDHFAFLPSFQCGTDTTLNVLSYAVDIGEGAATETEIGQNWMFTCGSDEAMDGAEPPMPAFVDVPSGTRLVMRASCSGALDLGNYNGVIHAVS